MRLDYYGAKKYVRMECESAKLGVQFHPPGSIKGPYTDGKTLHVYEPNALWTDDQWDDWEYEVYHEIGHEAPENRSPHWKDLTKEKKVGANTLLGSLWNLMSDHIQEHNRVGRYTGRDRVLKRGRARFVADRLLDDKTMSGEMDTKVGKIFKVASIYDTECRQNWNEHLAGMAGAAADSLDGEEREMMDKLLYSDIKLHEGKSEVDAYEFAKQILAALGEDPEKHEKEAQKAWEESKKAGGNGDGEGDGKKGKRGKDGKAGAGGKEDGTTGELSKKAKDEIKGMKHHTHYIKPKPDAYEPMPTADQHITYRDRSWGGVHSEFIPQDPVVVDIKKGEYSGMRIDSSRTARFTNLINKVEGGKVLAGQVKRLLISMKQLRWEHGQRRGHISSKNLWKARGPIYQDDVFKKRTQTLELDTAVCIVTDNSGSMSGSKFAHAAKAGIMLNEAMSKVGVPVELISFSENHRGPVNIIVKPFHERSVPDDELVDRYAQCGSWMNQNSDGESIMWAAQRLARRAEKRKVLIVLSDGSPAAYNGGDGSEYVYTEKVIKEIEASKSMEIYGIGIMDNNVEHLYKDHKVLNHADDLENMLLGLVKSKLLK